MEEVEGADEEEIGLAGGGAGEEAFEGCDQADCD